MDVGGDPLSKPYLENLFLFTTRNMQNTIGNKSLRTLSREQVFGTLKLHLERRRRALREVHPQRRRRGHPANRRYRKPFSRLALAPSLRRKLRVLRRTKMGQVHYRHRWRSSIVCQVPIRAIREALQQLGRPLSFRNGAVKCGRINCEDLDATCRSAMRDVIWASY